MPLVVEAMSQELRQQRDFLNNKNIDTIYFGGGTPSLLSVEQVEDFLSLIGELYDTSSLREVTLEANPDDLSLEYLQGLRSVGVNRLSIGVQSFDDEELRFMNRRHSAQQARDAVSNARDAGFDNIAIDLIFGVEGFDADVLQGSIESALALDVEHIAAYHLTIEPDTRFGKLVRSGEMHEVPESKSVEEYRLLHTSLTNAGYEHYEVSNYAKVGRRSKHNSSYWQGIEYLGIGAGAHSFNGTHRRWAVPSIESYLAGGEGRYEGEKLSALDCRNEMIMTSLRCAEGLDLRKFEELFGKDARRELERTAQRWIDSAELRSEGQRISIPAEHFMVSDMIIESMFG